MPTVLIADDHAPLRAGVSETLLQAGFDVVAAVGTGPEAVDAALRERPAVALLDVHMPGGGVRAATEISAQLPETAIVMLTVSDDEVDLFAALRAGASGYLLKDMDPARLPAALTSVLDGEAALPGKLVSRLVEEVRTPGRTRVRLPRGREVDLTPREAEVVELLRVGKSSGEIAYQLGISDVTVRRHVSEIVKKLQVENRAVAVRLLREHPRG
jgi:DNA-binding NarL/FixJ family response regulator